jgi:SAM-dependent methyltransferase
VKRLLSVLRKPLPLPPVEMRKLVGPTDEESFDNPSGELVFPYIEPERYEAFFDFGCGCGRVARQLIQQKERPKRYLGIDLHRGMIEWCRANLAPHARNFGFEHHNVFNRGLNSDETLPRTLPFPAEDDSFTLVNAWSVFTHLTEAQVPHYLSESARILRPDGVLHSTWFLFEKREFPMMQEHANALYINDIDPSAAVIFDRDWVQQAARNAGLTITAAHPPSIRGFQWTLLLQLPGPGVEGVELPADEAPYGLMRPPEMPAEAERIGLEGE